MRKTTKGAIAVGAGVALLLGGAGTLAAWSVSTTRVDETSRPVTQLTIPARLLVVGPTIARRTCRSPARGHRRHRDLEDRPGRHVVYAQAGHGDGPRATTSRPRPRSRGTPASPARSAGDSPSRRPPFAPPTGLTDGRPGRWSRRHGPDDHDDTAAAGQGRVSIKFEGATAGQVGRHSTAPSPAWRSCSSRRAHR